MAEFTLDEAYGKSQSDSTFGLDEAYAAPKSKLKVIEPERESNASIALQNSAGMLAGAAGQLSDMFTGIIAGVARLPYYVGARTSALAQTGDQKLSAQAAAIGAEEVLPEEVHAPFRKIAKTLGPDAERYYNENPIGQINNWISEFIAKGSEKGQSKTGIPSEDLMQGVDALMTFAGIKGTKVSLRKAIEERNAFKIMTEVNRAKKEAAEAQAARQEQQTGAIAQALREARVPIQQHINETLGVKTPQQRAAEHAARQKDLKAAMRQPAEGSDFVDIEESIFKAEERARQVDPYGYKEPPDTSTVYDTAKPAEINQRPFLPVEDLSPAQQFREAARILQTPGHERTAADLARLRRIREGGSSNPELLGLLGVAGIGSAVGASLSDDDLRGAVLGAAAGSAAALPFMGRGADVRQRMGQTGAVKGPGGMWHPEAVERLSEPLIDTITPYTFAQGRRILGPDVTLHKLNLQVGEQAHRMVRNYLNKHAGTSTDPLKDIEIPFGEGTKRWEELTDKLIGGKPQFVNTPAGPKAEVQFRLGKYYGEAGPDAAPAEQAITSYLSHVGDYLRQNVDPAKLPQYDLVRAVKETAANDARVAKQMEKAASDTTKQLPVYKDYGDGFKWVELKEPEKLTAEQMKSIKAVQEFDLAQMSLTPARKTREGFVAIDAQGKPIKNSYTQEVAVGATPKRAFLAGRLAEEGNQMGHCVGGYCEGVAAGESKIYSLRDAKGKSHVTVEVEPEHTGISRQMRQSSGENVDANILQIKGKQNRAPDSRYLPYVQDFVKSGKWGDVRDLENTGLLHNRYAKEYYTPEELAQKAGVTPEQVGLYLEGKLTPTESIPIRNALGQDTSMLGRRRNEQGSIDQQLLIGLGTVGLGGLIGSQLGEDPFVNSILGAAAGAVLGFTQGGKALGKQAVQNADDLLGRISTRLGNHDAGLALQMRNYERIRLFQTGEKLAHALPLMKAFGKLDEATKTAFTVAARNGDSETIAKIAKGNPELVAGVREARSLFTELGAEAQRLGRFKRMLPEYFPLLVKDYKGLLGALGKEEQGRLTTLIAAKNAERLGRGLPALSDGEIGKLINDNLRHSGDKKGADLSSYKTRKIQEITPELLPFYYDLPDSMFRTIVDTVADLETAKFFGKDSVNVTTPDGRTVLNTDASIGNYVGRLVSEGKLKPEAQLEIIELLKSRFKGGEQGAQTWSRTVRDIGHLSLLGNPGSAAMQLGDPIMALYAQGPRALISGVARSLTGMTKLSSRDYHLADHISQEFYENAMGIKSNKGKITQVALIGGGAAAGAALADDKISGALAGATVGFVSAVGLANAVNKVFRTSGFTLIDNFGKNVHLNAAVSNYQRLAETAAGRAKIAEKYKQSFGPWFPELLEDLKQKKITENVRLLAFNELSDYQPITKTEMSKVWLDNPNVGRLALTLKSFMQTQLDIYRRDVYNELRKGNKAKALRNLTALSLTLGVAGATGDAIQDFLMGKPVDITAGGVAENILKSVGLSEYVRDRAGKNPIITLGGVFVPPVQVMDKILTTDPKAVTAVPLLGKLYYNWELGGREEVELRAERKAKDAGRDYMISPRAEQLKERKQEKAEIRREKKELKRERAEQ